MWLAWDFRPWCVVVAAAFAVVPAFAAGPPDAASIAHRGKGAGVPACSSCHGRDGEGQAAAGFPRLAGLAAVYLQHQLDSFANGSRENPVMAPIAKALTEDERHALAVYHGHLPIPAAAAKGTQAPAGDTLGEELATRGRWSKQVPGCVMCHGPHGVGVGAHFPPLAGQSATYMANQLRDFQLGKRKNDPLGLMRHVALALDKADIRAVSEWFAAQPATSSMPSAAAHAAGGAAPTASAIRAPAFPVAPASASAALPKFTPPPDSAIPDNQFGALVRVGRNIFTDTQQYAKQYVGNGLNCQSCHLDAGRLANSAPMWAAYVRYPRYRAKNHKVNTFAERLQGCFRFSMNGKVPPADGEIIKALTAYSYWLATGAPTGMNLAGFGYPKLAEPPETPNYVRGRKVYATHCALCHTNDGQGQQVAGSYVFPPLWGRASFNWGAGMGDINNAAAFIKANMPFSRGGTLSDQDAWDVAYFVDAHERPQDPRFTGSVAETRERYHNDKWSLYGKQVNGYLLGSERAGTKQ